MHRKQIGRHRTTTNARASWHLRLKFWLGTAGHSDGEMFSWIWLGAIAWYAAVTRKASRRTRTIMQASWLLRVNATFDALAATSWTAPNYLNLKYSPVDQRHEVPVMPGANWNSNTAPYAITS